MHHFTDTKSKNFPGNWFNEVYSPQNVHDLHGGSLGNPPIDIKATDS